MATDGKPDGGFESPYALVQSLESSLISLDSIAVKSILRQCCNKLSPYDCVENLILPALEDIGKRWESGELSLSQVYISGKISEREIKELFGDDGQVERNGPRMAITVLEDHHTLGKKMVLSILRAGGFNVIDYGHGVTTEELIYMVARDKIEIMLISTLMLPAALRIKNAVEGIKKVSPNTKVLVGGAPFRFDKELWKKVGADGYARSASETLQLVKGIVEGASP